MLSVSAKWTNSRRHLVMQWDESQRMTSRDQAYIHYNLHQGHINRISCRLYIQQLSPLWNFLDIILELLTPWLPDIEVSDLYAILYCQSHNCWSTGKSTWELLLGPLMVYIYMKGVGKHFPPLFVNIRHFRCNISCSKKSIPSQYEVR